MIKQDSDRFYEVCKLAENQKWCWKLFCTTCGGLSFRMALYELSLGKSPLDHDWFTRGKSARMALDHYGVRYDQATKWIKSSVSLHNEISVSNIKPILSEVRWPDCLGMLGVAIYWTEDIETRTRKTTPFWKRQFREFFEETGVQIQELHLNFLRNDNQFRWKDLEYFENYGIMTLKSNSHFSKKDTS